MDAELSKVEIAILELYCVKDMNQQLTEEDIIRNLILCPSFSAEEIKRAIKKLIHDKMISAVYLLTDERGKPYIKAIMRN